MGAGKPKFDFPIFSFWGSKDRRISEGMVQGWQDFTSASFASHRIEGHHLWPLQPASKAVWLQQIAAILDAAKA
jgi:surfactin synthase thioesterase subunit